MIFHSETSGPEPNTVVRRKSHTARYTILKLQNTRDKGETLKISKEEKLIGYI